jgi:PhnB protein
MLKQARAPDRYRDAAIAHLMIDGAAAALDFYARAFDAQELMRIATPDGHVLHAETAIEGSVVMVGDADPPFAAPAASGGATVALHVYVEDVDARFAQAVAEGAVALQPVQDMFYGARSGIVRDPFGHVWILLTHQEDLDVHEVEARGAQLLAASAGEQR